MSDFAKSWGRLVASIVIVALAYGPLLFSFFRTQWDREQYQFFPFVLGAFGWLLYRNGSQSSPQSQGDQRERRIVLMGLLGTAWVLLVIAYVAMSPWLAVVSAVILVASMFVRVAGAWRVEYLWGIWAMLFLLVPPPLNRDQVLISKLQHISSRLSSFFLDWLGVHHLMEGNALLLPDKRFFVDQACSGIVSVMSVIACAVIYGLWRNRPPVHVILLALAGVAWATFMNVVRITSIAVVYSWFGLDWSSGTAHQTLGLVIFTFTFLALVSTDYLLVALLAPVSKTGDEPIGQPITYGAKVVKWFDWLQVWGAPRSEKVVAAAAARTRGRKEMWSRFALGLIPLLAFGTLAAAQFAVPTLIGLTTTTPPPYRYEQALALKEVDLPAKLAGLERVEFTADRREGDQLKELGEYSRSYRYRDEDGHEYVVSCDFPFGPEWHDLTICYEGAGWTTGPKNVVSMPGADEWGYVQAEFSKPNTSALLTYSMFDERGTCLEPPSGSLLTDSWRSLQKRYEEKQPARQFQVQVFTNVTGNLDEKQRSNSLKLLLAARDHLYQSITHPAESNADGSAP